MFGATVRLLILVFCLSLSWYATGSVMALVWPTEPYLGFVGALGVELVLGYSIFTLSKTDQKAMVSTMIIVFGVISMAAQVLHAVVAGTPLPPAVIAKLDSKIVWIWQFVLPSIPTLAGMSVGLLAVAEESNFEAQIIHGVGQRISEFFNIFHLGNKSKPRGFQSFASTTPQMQPKKRGRPPTQSPFTPPSLPPDLNDDEDSG